ncbi:MAG: acyl-CoA desaturase [Bacteroidales bacterium]|nr:acyl-CoA desaturase [Bacteroidales bacterium]
MKKKINIHYQTNKGQEFFNILRQRVNNYFIDNKIKKHGNMNMYLKTVFMFLLFTIPYILMISNVFTSPMVFIFLWIIMGFGMAGIGLSVMHDANHGSYSGNKMINRIMGYTLNLVGGNSFLWKIQHNQLHHAYTNIEDADDDIYVPVFLRFSPNSKKYWIQQYQHIYVWFFYAISTLSWVTTKNFLQISRYQKKGLITGKNKVFKLVAEEILWKLVYYTLFIGLPVILLPYSFWTVLLAFVIMHICIGFTLSMIFQPAHVIPTSEFPLPDNHGNMENSWAIHQLLTTSDYAPGSKLFSWLIGGLNFQVVHHLFPNICHVHYRKISKIIQKTVIEHNIPYHVQPSFAVAVYNHAKMLRHLGNYDNVSGMKIFLPFVKRSIS